VKVIFAQLARLLHPPRVVRVTSRPRWFAVGRRLENVVAWGLLADGSVVGLVPDRRGGLRPARGWGWHGFLPGAPLSASDVQRDPPTDVRFVAADLTEALGDPRDFGSPQALAEIYSRLRDAVDDSAWARQALVGLLESGERYLTLHLRSIAEHGHAADLTADERAFLASLTAAPNPEPKEDHHA
jgi:hypothetical protein